MEVKVDVIQDGERIVYIDGRLDTVNSGDFESSLKPLIEDKVMNITLDCSNLSYISSSGLRVFLTLLKQVSAYKGTLILQGMKQEILEIFNMTGFSQLFTIK